jgi:hypothetical protein
LAQINQAYATTEEYRAVITKDDPADDIVLARHLSACSRFYDRTTGEFWGKESPAVARIWEGDGSNCLRVKGGIDLCPGIADPTGMTVELDSNLNGTYATTFTSGQYECHPLNNAFGPEPQPFTELVILPGRVPATSLGLQGCASRSRRFMATTPSPKTCGRTSSSSAASGVAKPRDLRET